MDRPASRCALCVASASGLYFHTGDIDASVERALELGGKTDEVQTVPEVGRIVHCQDDQSTPFSLFEPARQG